MKHLRISALLRIVAATIVLAVPAVAPEVASAGWTWDDTAGWTWDEVTQPADRTAP